MNNMSDDKKRIAYYRLPAQARFIDSTKKHVLYSGGFGSGKSQALCLALLKQAVIPNNAVLLIRKTLVSLKKSTLINLIGGSNAVLPNGSYIYNKSDATIKVNGGGIIYCCGMDDPQRIRSMNLGAAFIDEVTEFTEEEFKEVGWRLRLEYGSRQLKCCGNPAGPNHFLYKHFFLDDNNNREVITASSLENTYLPKDYIDELKTMEGTQYKRYVEGQWVALDNVIFDSFDRNIHVQKITKMKCFDEYIIGVDYGYTHNTGVVVVGKTGSRIAIINEFYRNKLLLRDIVDKIKEFSDIYGNPVIVYDPSAAGLGAELLNLELNAIKANNDVEAGIDRIRNKLRIRNDSPDLIISDFCINTIKEMENYQYQPGTEKPIKVGDDLVDPLRYIVNFIDDQKAEHSKTPFLITASDEEDEGWTPLANRF